MSFSAVDVQTDYRESEAQTDPCTLDYVYDYKDVLPEVSALECLRYDQGSLPARGQEDLEVVGLHREAHFVGG